VALKLLPDAMAADPAAAERFAREARAIAALSHPHIVTIYSTEVHGDVRFLTMEMIEGRTLDQVIPPAGVEIARFFDIAIALADALRAAHAKQITHRDLKPSNVMIGNDGLVKVLDFGLASAGAAAPDDTVTRPSLTQAGMVMGTVPYMSPEQIEGKAIDHRSDLFSLGIVMYEMAGGRPPVSGD
jgi:serine/threonine protein kinase